MLVGKDPDLSLVLERGCTLSDCASENKEKSGVESGFSLWVGLGPPFACFLLGMSVLCLQPHSCFQEEGGGEREEKEGRIGG